MRKPLLKAVNDGADQAALYGVGLDQYESTFHDIPLQIQVVVHCLGREASMGKAVPKTLKMTALIGKRGQHCAGFAHGCRPDCCILQQSLTLGFASFQLAGMAARL